MAQAPTPEKLLARVARRDEGALGELYDRFAPELLGMLLPVLSKRQAAEEVLQETFLKLAGEARRFAKDGASVAAGLVLMARAKAVERLRAERHLTPLPPGPLDSLQKSAAWLPRPEEITLLDERRDLLMKVMNQLPQHQREALELAVFEGFTETEMAGKFGETLGRVRSGLFAATRFLRHRLGAVLRTWTADI